MAITITFQSLLGFRTTFRHLDDREVEVSRDGITKPRQKITLRDEGMPHFEYPSRAGNLHAFANIVFPETLTQRQKDVIDKVFPA